MGNRILACSCCRDRDRLAGDDFEIKKNDCPESYPAVISTMNPPGDESADKGYVYVPEEISSIDFYQYSEEVPAKDGFLSVNDGKKNLVNTISLGTIQEISNSEVNDFLPSHLLNTEELIKGNLTVSENLTKVLELRLSDSYSYGDSDFDKKLHRLQ